jgi:hypothetical protein
VVDPARRLAHQLLNVSRGDQEDARGAASQGLFSVQFERGSEVSSPTQPCEALNDAQPRGYEAHACRIVVAREQLLLSIFPILLRPKLDPATLCQGQRVGQ